MIVRRRTDLITINYFNHKFEQHTQREFVCSYFCLLLLAACAFLHCEYTHEGLNSSCLKAIFQLLGSYKTIVDVFLLVNRDILVPG